MSAAIFSKFTAIGLVAMLVMACDPSAKANSGYSANSPLKELSNLERLGKKARTNNLPIMLAVGAEFCEFCHILREEVLDPMALGGEYEGKYMYMRYFSIDDRFPIPGIDGKPMYKEKWAYQHNADLTPTVIFIDGEGKEVAEKIIGISNIELFSALIHSRLNQAYKNMGNPLRISPMPI